MGLYCEVTAYSVILCVHVQYALVTLSRLLHQIDVWSRLAWKLLHNMWNVMLQEMLTA